MHQGRLEGEFYSTHNGTSSQCKVTVEIYATLAYYLVRRNYAS
jgi:hypothetical protein